MAAALADLARAPSHIIKCLVEYLIKQYALEPGAWEIQYIEEYFGEFPRRKTATEIIDRVYETLFAICLVGIRKHAPFGQCSIKSEVNELPWALSFVLL